MRKNYYFRRIGFFLDAFSCSLNIFICFFRSFQLIVILKIENVKFNKKEKCEKANCATCAFIILKNFSSQPFLHKFKITSSTFPDTQFIADIKCFIQQFIDLICFVIHNISYCCCFNVFQLFTTVNINFRKGVYLFQNIFTW